MPSVPAARAVVAAYTKKGFWVFHPRYRGTWESGGKFLRRSPEKDILDVITALPRGFQDFWNKKTYRVKPEQIFLLASSFGGAPALLASRDKRVTKVIALSPVVDWQAPSKAEPLDWLGRYVKMAYGESYRFSPNDWQKLKKGNFCNPVRHLKEINGSKILIFHAKDDKSVLWRPVYRFARAVGAKIFLKKGGGHFSSSLFVNPAVMKKILKFIKK